METRIKILYIDDEELNLTAFVRLFRRLYDITTASSAAEGREILKSQTFHVVLVDQRMPGTTGSEFFKEIATLYPDIMRVLVTAYSDLNAVVSAVNDGKIYKYVSKPYGKEEMMAVVEEAYQVLHLRELQKSDYSKYKELFENSRDSIFLVSKKGKIIDANDACLSLLDFTRDDLIAHELATNIFEKISIKFEFSSEKNEYQEIDNKEATFRMQNGEFHDCLVSFVKIKDEDGDLVGYQGTIKNITTYKVSKRNSMRGLLEQKEKEKESVVDVLHEKSAQNLAWIHYLLSHLENKTEQVDAKETLSGVNSTLKETIEELRDLCFQILPKSLEYGISGALQDLSSKMNQAYNTTFDLKLANELEYVSKDFRIMIFRAVQNILRGLKKEDATVSIETKNFENYICSEITGIKQENMDVILDQLKVEIDCYTGIVLESHTLEGKVSYKMLFPIEEA